MLQQTWFSTGDDHSTQIFGTVTGTAPGSPVADLFFQISFSGALRRLEQEVQAAARTVQKIVHTDSAAASLAILPIPS